MDKLAPMVCIHSDNNLKNQKLPSHLKQKINKRKRLLGLDRNLDIPTHVEAIKVLDNEIKTFLPKEELVGYVKQQQVLMQTFGMQ